VYESYFGLRARPFQLNPDPDFFYGSRGHKRALAYLEYGLHQAEGFIVITGEVGAGKTTLLRGLLRRIDPQKIVAAQVVSTQVDADDLLRLVASAFGVPEEGLGKASLLSRLGANLHALHGEGRRALLIVDEAQNLTPSAVEELRMLSNFQVGSQSLLQSFLVGQPEFRGIMQRPEMSQLKQRVIASYHLGPLDNRETQGYIDHRLKHAGWSGSPRFEPPAYERIHALSEGVPRRINTLCDRLLLNAFLAERKVVTASDVAEVAAELTGETGLPDAREAEPPAPARVAPITLRPSPAPATGASDGVAALRERIEALETSQALLIGMLNRVVGTLLSQPERSPAPASDPPGPT
jgi:putative secretion ATPase (PEP-CTERM system associated)